MKPHVLVRCILPQSVRELLRNRGYCVEYQILECSLRKLHWQIDPVYVCNDNNKEVIIGGQFGCDRICDQNVEEYLAKCNTSQ